MTVKGGRRRRDLINPEMYVDLDTPIEFLDVNESGSCFHYNWHFPERTEYGVKTNNPFSIYAQNYEQIRNALKEKLSGETLVLTHNPWGEYGHEEHIQVFQAVTSLMNEMNFTVWVDSYIKDTAFQLAASYHGSIEPATGMMKTNKVLARKLKRFYIDNHCWTWSSSFEWPEYEYFLQVKRDHVNSNQLHDCSLPLNVVYGHQSHLFLIGRFIQKYTPQWLYKGIKKFSIWLAFKFNHKH
jgi:hypothetical protein